MNKPEKITDLSKEELLELCNIYAKNWLAHDGLWFQAVEKSYGLKKAIELDIEAWKKFTVIEARRIIDFLNLGENSGLEGLRRALAFRLYASLNEDEIIIEAENVLVYRVKTCRVQYARERRSLPYFPCKPVGIVEYGLFAKTIDHRFSTEAISCHPEITEPGYNCIWRFTLNC